MKLVKLVLLDENFAHNPESLWYKRYVLIKRVWQQVRTAHTRILLTNVYVWIFSMDSPIL